VFIAIRKVDQYLSIFVEDFGMKAYGLANVERFSGLSCERYAGD